MNPPDIIKLAPGNYKLGLDIRLVGTPDRPIKIVGSGPTTKIELISSDSKYCLGFHGSHFVELHDLHFSNCGEIYIWLVDSTYITFKNIDFVGGRAPIYAEGQGTHHILMDSISWDQDPSGRIYGEIPWPELHHGEYVHFNGSVFYGNRIAGSVILRNSTIKNAFNGIGGVGIKEKSGSANLNVEIYNNLFKNIRDNPVEPVDDATNWWIHHNIIQDAHAYFSFVEVSGGDWYIFRNIGISEKILTGENTSGKVLKFGGRGPLPSGPFLVFNNSWLGPRPIATGGVSRNLQYFNNAHQFSGKAVPLKEASYHSSYQIQNNLVNVAFERDELNKINTYLPSFQFQEKADLRSRSRELIDAGIKITVNDYAVKFSGKAPDVGAYENDGPADYPPFRFNDSIYNEHPRIVKVDNAKKGSLTLWSSVKLAEKKNLHAKAIYKNGEILEIPIQIRDYRVVFKLLNAELLDELQLPALLGTNGLNMLTWGAIKTDFSISIQI